MNKKLAAFALALTMSLSLLAGCGGQESTPSAPADSSAPAQTQARELRMSLPVPEDTDSYDQAVLAKEYIEEKTEGALTVTIYPANQLGDWTQVFDELMMGSIDMAISNAPDTYNPIIGITSFPYICYDYDSCREFFSNESFLYDAVGEALDGQGIKFLGFSMSGFDGIGTKDPVQNANVANADKDCVVRVPTLDSVKASVERLGFRTSSLPYTDTYSSIQTGVVDGWIGAPPYQHYLGFADVENNYYAYNSLNEVFDIMVSKTVWDSFTPEQQTIVADAMNLASKASIDDAEAGDELYMDKLEEKGFNVVRFTADELKAFAEDCRANVWPEFESAFGADFMAQLQEAVK